MDLEESLMALVAEGNTPALASFVKQLGPWLSFEDLTGVGFGWAEKSFFGPVAVTPQSTSKGSSSSWTPR